MALTWPAIKDPDEVKDYSLDWSALLGASDTITSSTWSIDEGDGLTIDSDSARPPQPRYGSPPARPGRITAWSTEW